MAQLRTLKHGRLYLLKDGSMFNDFAQASVSSGCFFEKSDGSWGVLMEESGDIVPYAGGRPASIQAATPSAVLAGIPNYSKPVTYYDGSRLHIWVNRSTDSDITYAYSDNDAGSVTLGSDLNLVGDETWCNDEIWPLYFDYEADGTDTHRLWCVGLNGSTYTLGYVAVDTSGGAFNTEINQAASYTAQSSGAGLESLDHHLAMTRIGALYCVYGRASNGIALVTSSDGSSWSRSTIPGTQTTFDIGITGSKDDTSVLPFGVVAHQGMIHLLYGGNDGSATRAMLAVGESPDRLYKVPWMDVGTFGNNDILADFAADLTFSMPDQSSHVMNRNGPGALIDAPFTPSALSFTIRQTFELGSSGDEFGWLAGLASPEAGEDSVTANPGELGRLNIAYITENDAGTPSEFYLFPMVGIQSLETSEGAEGNVITVTGQMHSMQRPLFGSIT